MRIIKRVVMGVGLLFGVGLVALTLAVVVKKDRTFTAPESTLKASTDPQIIERGKYLATGPAHCVECHGDAKVTEVAFKQHEPIPEGVALSGGNLFDLPPGKLYAPNLTPDPETGTGRRSDADLVRIWRYSVRPDGRAVLPLMPFQNLSDDDVVALLSYLRSLPPVKNQVRDHEWSLLGVIVRALLLKPEGPRETPPKASPSGPTVENGRYLAHSVANCYGCHTNRDLKTGEFIGKPFAGGLVFPALGDPSKEVLPPNLTPDPETGITGKWDEEQFLKRLKQGNGVPGTHMPWQSFSRMTDDDIRAIYRYLKTVPPVKNDVGPTLRNKA